MRTVGDRHDPLPALTLSRVVGDGQEPGRLHDPAVAGEIREPALQTTFGQAAILWTIDAVQSIRVVDRRDLGPPRRRRTIRPAFACRVVILAGDRRLEKRKL